MRRVTVLFREKNEEMMKALKEKWAATSMTDVILRAISMSYNKEFPSYVQIAQEKISNKLTPEEKAKQKVEQKGLEEKVKAENFDRKQRAICDALGGTIMDINGFPHCRYEQYTEIGGKKVDSGFLTEPLENLNDESVIYQYRTIMGETGEKAKEKLLGLMGNKNQ